MYVPKRMQRLLAKFSYFCCISYSQWTYKEINIFYLESFVMLECVDKRFIVKVKYHANDVQQVGSP